MPKNSGGGARGDRRGDIDLVVGTQALIQKDVAFNQLASWSWTSSTIRRAQRHEFRSKAPDGRPPAYRAHRITCHDRDADPADAGDDRLGDLDVSVLKHSPPGRGRIIQRS